MRGTVAAFDAHQGLGVIQGAASESYSFHCVSLADGSREIAIGTEVFFVTRVGLQGHDEAVDIYALSGVDEKRT